MALPDIIDQRLTDLENKATYMEDLVEQLDKIIVHQQEQIARLLRDVAELRQPTPENSLVGHHSLRDELPPHF